MRSTRAHRIFTLGLLALCLCFIHGCTPVGGDTVYRTLTIKTDGSGSVLPSDSVSKPINSLVTLRAIPDAGAKFDHWEGGLTGSTNPVQFKLTADVTVTAVFIPGTTHRTPEAYDLTVTATKSQPVNFQLAGRSPDEKTLTYEPQGIPPHGNISFLAPTITYIPSNGYIGPDGFEYKVSDTEASPVAKVNITVADTGLAGWAHSFGSTGADVVYGMDLDTGGNVLAAGKFTGTVDFDPGPKNELHSAGGKADAFVSKFDSAGQLLWTRTFGGGEDDLATAVTTDTANNVYVVGIFSGTMMIDLESGTNLSSQGNKAGFICKFDSEGKFLWANVITGAGDAGVNCAVADAAGNLYVGGGFTGKAAFDQNEPNDDESSRGKLDGFLAAYNSAGEFVWVDLFGGLGNDEITAVALEVGGSIYAAGNFESSIDLDPSSGTDSVTSEGQIDAFVTKLNAGGNRIWTKVIGGTGVDKIYGLAADTTGNYVAVCGSFEASFNFNHGGEIDRQTAVGGADGFVTRFTTSGHYEWTRTFGGSGKDYCNHIMFDTVGSVYVVGAFTGTVDFKKGFGIATTDKKTSAGLLDAFVTQIFADGAYGFTATTGGSGDDGGNSIIQNKSSLATYWGGFFQSTAELSPDKDHEQKHVAFGADDCFLIEMNGDGTW